MFTFSPFNGGQNVFTAASVNVGVTLIQAGSAGGDKSGVDTRNEQARLVMHPYTMNIVQKSVEKRLPMERHQDAFDKQVGYLKEKMGFLRHTSRRAGGFRPAESGQAWKQLKDSFLITALLDMEDVKMLVTKITNFMVSYGLLADDIQDAEYGVDFGDCESMAKSLRDLTEVVYEQVKQGKSDRVAQTFVFKFLR